MNEEDRRLKELLRKCEEMDKVLDRISADLDQIKRERSRWWIPLLWQFVLAQSDYVGH